MFLFLEAYNRISKISLKTKAVDSNFFLLTRQTTILLNTRLHALNKSSRMENTTSIVKIMKYSHRKSSEPRTRPLHRKSAGINIVIAVWDRYHTMIADSRNTWDNCVPVAQLCQPWPCAVWHTNFHPYSSKYQCQSSHLTGFDKLPWIRYHLILSCTCFHRNSWMPAVHPHCTSPMMDDQLMEMKMMLSHDVSLAYVDNVPLNDEIESCVRRKKVGSTNGSVNEIANENRNWDTHQSVAERWNSAAVVVVVEQKLVPHA